MASLVIGFVSKHRFTRSVADHEYVWHTSSQIIVMANEPTLVRGDRGQILQPDILSTWATTYGNQHAIVFFGAELVWSFEGDLDFLAGLGQATDFCVEKNSLVKKLL